ncbi:MAG TPA: hypothetical protein VHS53_09670 [Mucilaginibacter sp.]|jgi:hypothetical protein|nr:hypothetical protein [Mucilaginibacter sp.]
MKTLLLTCGLALLVFGLTFSACKKSSSSQTFQSKGVITLNLLFTCASCPGGGYYIRFSSDTATLYHIDNDLTPFGITTSSTFPMNVTATWKPDRNAPQAANVAAGDNVIITALKIDN